MPRCVNCKVFEEIDVELEKIDEGEAPLGPEAVPHTYTNYRCPRCGLYLNFFFLKGG